MGKQDLSVCGHRIACAGMAAMAVAALTACAPDLGPLPQTQAAANYATAKSFAAPQASWPSDDWWKAYGDPELDRLIDEALAGSPDLKMASARVGGAEAMADINGANLWPTLVGEAALQETEETRNIGFPEPYTALLPRGWHHAAEIAGEFQYQLDFFGKNRAAFAAATSTAQAARAEEAEARLQISTADAATYAVLVQLTADQQTADDAVRIRQQSAALVEQRLKNGLENDGTLSQARAQLEAAKVESAAIGRMVALVRNQLAALLGKGPDRGLLIAPNAGQKVRSVGLPATLSVDLIGRRPDIVAARWNAQAAASQLDVANANFYPDVDLVGKFGLQSLDMASLVQSSSEMGQFGPAMHLPIFDYGRNTGIYRASRAQYDGAVALYDKTLSGALHEVADAYANQRALAHQLVHAHASLAESEKAYGVVRQRYDAGLSRYLDVLTAENMLLMQRRAVADLEAQSFAYDVALVRALGGGYVDKN